MSEQDHKQIVWYTHVIEKKLNPFILSEELLLNTVRYFHTGFYKEAVAFAQCSVEIFINILFKKISEYEGEDEMEISNIIEKILFKNILKKEIPKRLVGSWDIENKTSKVGVWHSKCYEIRNKTIHGVYVPSFNETNEAILSVEKLEIYITELIKANKENYPRLSEYFRETR